MPARASSATLIVQPPVTGWPLAKKKLIEYFWKCLVSAEFCRIQNQIQNSGMLLGGPTGLSELRWLAGTAVWPESLSERGEVGGTRR